MVRPIGPAPQVMETIGSVRRGAPVCGDRRLHRREIGPGLVGGAHRDAPGQGSSCIIETSQIRETPTLAHSPLAPARIPEG